MHWLHIFFLGPDKSNFIISILSLFITTVAAYFIVSSVYTLYFMKIWLAPNVIANYSYLTISSIIYY